MSYFVSASTEHKALEINHVIARISDLSFYYRVVFQYVAAPGFIHPTDDEPWAVSCSADYE